MNPLILILGAPLLVSAVTTGLCLSWGWRQRRSQPRPRASFDRPRGCEQPRCRLCHPQPNPWEGLAGRNNGGRS